MKHWVSLLTGLVCVAPCVASPELDERHAMKSVVAAVVASPVEQVWAEQVESALIEYLKNHSRYEFLEAETSHFREQVRALPVPESAESIDPYKPAITAAAKGGVQAVMLGRILKHDETYEVAISLINARAIEVVHSERVGVEDFRRLQSFTDATRQAAALATAAIPFHATILNRDGYRVVLDRGHPDLRRGMQIRTYTLSLKADQLVFEETGAIVVTRAEKRIAFGKVILDKRPLEVAAGQKLKLDASGGNPLGMSIASHAPTREPASILAHEMRRGGRGSVAVDLGAVLVNVTNSGVRGKTTSTGSALHPGLRLTAEAQVTSRVFAEMGVNFATASVSDTASTSANASTASLNSKVSHFRIAAGYRLGSIFVDEGPQIFFKAGISQQSYSIDPSPAPILFTSQTYRGPLLGIGGSLPLNRDYGLGFELGMMLFPGLTESPVTSGAEYSASTGWDFGMHGYYHIAQNLDARARILFQSHGADFTGTGTRDVGQFSTSQTTRAFLMGISYFF